MKSIQYLLIVILMAAFLPAHSQNPSFDIQGHRGARGMMPENSIPGFMYAVKAGVTTLELDVVISKDKKIVVSHDPRMSPFICSHPDGSPVQASEEDILNLYQLEYDEIKKYDCGSRGNEKFPEQKKVATSKPLLSDVINTIEKMTKAKRHTKVFYNIEIKSEAGQDEVFHPTPKEFVQLVYEELKKWNIFDRIIIQSFDVRALQAMKLLDEKVALSYLIGYDQSITENLNKLGFTPDIYSPNYEYFDQTVVNMAHEKGMKVIPWTVNDPADMKRFISWGVDGIITDYPQKLVELSGKN